MDTSTDIIYDTINTDMAIFKNTRYDTNMAIFNTYIIFIILLIQQLLNIKIIGGWRYNNPKGLSSSTLPLPRALSTLASVSIVSRNR